MLVRMKASPFKAVVHAGFDHWNALELPNSLFIQEEGGTDKCPRHGCYYFDPEWLVVKSTIARRTPSGDGVAAHTSGSKPKVRRR